MNNPIEMLMQEHKIILQVVHALSVIDSDLEQGREVDMVVIKQVVDFMREFADKNHHAKEEDILFPALEEKGVPHTGCPLGGLMGEHVKGRGLVKDLSTSADQYAHGEENAIADMRAAIAGILQLYPNHIWKEDEMVFPMADRFFSRDEQNKMKIDFEKAEQCLNGKRDQYVAFANEMEKLHARE